MAPPPTRWNGQVGNDRHSILEESLTDEHYSTRRLAQLQDLLLAVHSGCHYYSPMDHPIHREW